MGAVERDGGSMHGWRALSLRGKAAVWLISFPVDDHKRMRIILGAMCWPTPGQWGHAWQQDLSGTAEHHSRVYPTSPWGRRGEGSSPTPPSLGSRKGALRHPLSTLLVGSYWCPHLPVLVHLPKPSHALRGALLPVSSGSHPIPFHQAAAAAIPRHQVQKTIPRQRGKRAFEWVSFPCRGGDRSVRTHKHLRCISSGRSSGAEPAAASLRFSMIYANLGMAFVQNSPKNPPNPTTLPRSGTMA